MATNSIANDLLQTPIDPEMLRPKTDEELAAILEKEAALAWLYRYERGAIDNLGYYLADKDYLKYTRVSSRGTSSQMISKDVAESIDDLMADLTRVVRSSDQLLEYESGGPRDAAYLRQATLFVNGILRSQEDFQDQLHDFIKDGLIQQVGVFEIVILQERVIPEHISGVRVETIIAYAARDDVETVEVEDVKPGLYNMTVKRKVPRQFRVDSVLPMDVLVSQGHDSLDQKTTEGARYVAVRKTMSVASAIDQWPQKRDLWLRAAAGNQTAPSVADIGHAQALADFSRWRQEDGSGGATAQNLLATNVTVMREYYRCDLDGDGYPELTMILRAGNLVIHKEAVEDNNLAYWTPYRIPHQLKGEGQADKLRNMQDLRTSFLRSLNDGTAYACRPRIAFDYAATRDTDIPTMSDIIRCEPGGGIRTAGPPEQAIKSLEIGDATTPVLKAMELTAMLKEGWSGQSRRKRGLDPGAVTNESGVKWDKMLQASSGRQEFLAGRLSQGIEMLGRKLLALSTQYGDVQSVKIEGEWQEVDPTEWERTMRPIVHVSGAVGSLDIEIQNLLLLTQKISEFIQMAGPENPWAGFPEMAETLAELVSVCGFRNGDRFIKTPSPQQIQQFMEMLMARQQEDPKITAEKIKAEAKELEVQSAAQMDKYRLDQTSGTEKVKLLAEIKEAFAKIALEKAIEARKADIEERKLAIERKKAEAQMVAAKRPAATPAQ